MTINNRPNSNRLSEQVMEPIFSIDAEAVAYGGQRAGQMLERIGKTDLAQLTADEWQEFCGVLVTYTMDRALHGLVLRLEREPDGESV